MDRISKLEELIEETDNLIKSRINAADSTEFESWHVKSEQILIKLFGRDSNEFKRFSNIIFFPIAFCGSDDFDDLSIKECQKGLRTARAQFEVYLGEMNEELLETQGSVGRTDAKEYDVFVSHASADKLEYVGELNKMLQHLGISIFYDDESISWGDDWKQKILDGVNKSEFAIVVISDNFFGREWTEIELDEFLTQQNERGQKVVLPLLYKTSIEKMSSNYPGLTSIQCISSGDYDTKDIALLLAKELIRRYKDK